jgi:hypothetical protein
MTIIYDMASGSIQSETALETGCPDESTIAGHAAEPRLAMVETRHTPRERDNPQSAIHIIRSLLPSD